VTSGAGQGNINFSLNVVHCIRRKRPGKHSTPSFRFEGGKVAVRKKFHEEQSDEGPNPSPDGEWVTFTPGASKKIYIAHSDGTGERYLTNDNTRSFRDGRRTESASRSTRTGRAILKSGSSIRMEAD
jgi:hypothetical protein